MVCTGRCLRPGCALVPPAPLRLQAPMVPLPGPLQCSELLSVPGRLLSSAARFLVLVLQIPGMSPFGKPSRLQWRGGSHTPHGALFLGPRARSLGSSLTVAVGGQRWPLLSSLYLDRT